MSPMPSQGPPKPALVSENTRAEMDQNANALDVEDWFIRERVTGRNPIVSIPDRLAMPRSRSGSVVTGAPPAAVPSFARENGP